MEPLYCKHFTINAPNRKVWELFTKQSISSTGILHESWHCPKAENNLEIGGEFFIPWRPKINLVSFVFTALTQKLFRIKKIEYFIEDGRKVEDFSIK